MTRPCLTVDLNAVRQNFETVCRLTQARVCPVVKSNAYGLGAVEITRALQDAGAVYVSTAQEGAELRGAFSDLQINVLNGIDGDSAALFSEKRLTPVISSVEQAKLWDGGFVLIIWTRILLGSVCFSSLFLVVFNILIFLNKSAFLPLEAKRGHFLF